MKLRFIYFCILVFIVPLKGKTMLRVKIARPEKMQGRVVGGHPVDIKKFPSAALIFNIGAMCSGTVVHSWVVLTASHCFDHNNDVEYISVHVGARHRIDSTAQVHDVAYLVRHEDYNKAMPFACDIALIFVEQQFLFRNIVKKDIIAGDDSWMHERETKFFVYGWGMVTYAGKPSEVGLLMTTMHFIPRDKCGELHNLTLTPDMFCLYGDGKRDTCKGDSGGGVLWNKLLVGIVSHGDGCALKNKPSVYSNVFYFRSWIKNTMQKYFDQHCRNKIKSNVTPQNNKNI